MVSAQVLLDMCGPPDEAAASNDVSHADESAPLADLSLDPACPEVTSLFFLAGDSKNQPSASVLHADWLQTWQQFCILFHMKSWILQTAFLLMHLCASTDESLLTES